MRIRTYRGHRVELESDRIRAREWMARAIIVIVEGKKEKRIPIFGRRRGTFDTQKQADAYALELAKLWTTAEPGATTGMDRRK
jgi:hypothetical protein